MFVRVFPPFSGGCWHELSVMLVYFCALCFHWGCVLLGTALAVLPGGLAGGCASRDDGQSLSCVAEPGRCKLWLSTHGVYTVLTLCPEPGPNPQTLLTCVSAAHGSVCLLPWPGLRRPSWGPDLVSGHLTSARTQQTFPACVGLCSYLQFC